VKNSDDERFEGYLREFRPLEPERLPVKHGTSRRVVIHFAAWTAAAALLLVTAALTLRLTPGPARPSRTAEWNADDAPFTNPQPLTIAEANALLARSPSVQAVIDRLAFQPEAIQQAKGKQSALAALSKEKIRL